MRREKTQIVKLLIPNWCHYFGPPCTASEFCRCIHPRKL